MGYWAEDGAYGLCRLGVVLPTKPAQAISSIFSPITQLGPKGKESTTKTALAWLRCDADSLEVIISLILSYKFRKKTALLRCTANQVGTGHKLYFHPKNPVRAKLAATNNKNGCGTADV